MSHKMKSQCIMIAILAVLLSLLWFETWEMVVTLTLLVGVFGFTEWLEGRKISASEEIDKRVQKLEERLNNLTLRGLK